MKHPHSATAHPVTHPVARCTAFAAVVAIGALSMSAPAAASPVATTPDGVAAPTTRTGPGTTDIPSATLADGPGALDARTERALADATSALVQAQHLTEATDMGAKRARRIETAAAEVRELVVTATAVSAEGTLAASAAAALADRTERASRTQERSPVPGDARRADDADPANTEVSAAHLTEATETLSGLLRAPAGHTVSKVVPGPSKKEIAAQKAAARAKAEAKAAAKAAKAAAKAEAKARARAQADRKQAAALAARATKHGNGRIPSNLLCDLSFAPGEELRCDAAMAIEKLNAAFRAAFGRNLTVNDSYRSYADQVAVAATMGALAAPPGTSNHGLGQAIDLGGGISTFGSAEYRWMAANAGKFGWIHPAWAEPGGSKPEAWHWEYGTGA
ncbi:M15 family metallopeptidase [Myceligenerans salitolerans]|nr:M15 family metallopeptidase [Myceligenerans salitolerans]